MTSFRKKVKPWVCVVDLRHVKEPQDEIRASEQNLSDFSRSMSEATLMILEVKKFRKPKNNYDDIKKRSYLFIEITNKKIPVLNHS